MWSGVREGDGPHERATAIDATRQAALAVRRLHQMGWRHANLQPATILCPPTGPAQLLDYGFAQGPDDGLLPSVCYRGALPDVTAPEIAAEILGTGDDHDVFLTTAAEIYMLGATLHRAWTGHWPARYDTDDPTCGEIYRAITDPARRRPLPDHWPRIGPRHQHDDGDRSLTAAHRRRHRRADGLDAMTPPQRRPLPVSKPLRARLERSPSPHRRPTRLSALPPGGAEV